MSWFLAALKKYATFGGRACRSEYWCFFLFYVAIALVLGVVDGAFGFLDGRQGMGPLAGLFVLAMLLPSLAVSARRLHDIGRSGWWLLLSLLPLVGAVVLLLFALRDSDPGDNAYGPNPKAVVAL